MVRMTGYEEVAEEPEKVEDGVLQRQRTQWKKRYLCQASTCGSTGGAFESLQRNGSSGAVRGWRLTESLTVSLFQSMLPVDALMLSIQ